MEGSACAPTFQASTPKTVEYVEHVPQFVSSYVSLFLNWLIRSRCGSSPTGSGGVLYQGTVVVSAASVSFSWNGMIHQKACIACGAGSMRLNGSAKLASAGFVMRGAGQETTSINAGAASRSALSPCRTRSRSQNQRASSRTSRRQKQRTVGASSHAR